MPLTLTSSAFQHGGPIPRRHTCQGADSSPPLAWTGVPEGTRSLALIVDDPDAPDPAAPKRVYVHWVLHDIPPTATGLPGTGGWSRRRDRGQCRRRDPGPARRC